MHNTDRPYTWCIICLQPNLQHYILNRFQRRHEAETHLKVLRQMMPSASYMVMFDGAPEPMETIQPHWQHS